MILNRYLLSLGANLGDLHENLQKAEHELLLLGSIVARSRPALTKPLSYSDGREIGQPLYLNMVVDFRVNLLPEALYKEIVRIEDWLGHNRQQKGENRHMDIDILLYAKDSSPRFDACQMLLYSGQTSLSIPHKELWQRAFLIELIQDLGLSEYYIISKADYSIEVKK